MTIVLKLLRIHLFPSTISTMPAWKHGCMKNGLNGRRNLHLGLTVISRGACRRDCFHVTRAINLHRYLDRLKAMVVRAGRIGFARSAKVVPGASDDDDGDIS